MNIIVIGSRGRIGSTVCKILSNSPNTLIGIDKHNVGILGDVLDRADLIIIATPFDVSVEYLEQLSSRVRCMELTSSKSPMLRFKDRVISIHPLFGPGSFEDKEMKNIAFISDISSQNSENLVRELFHGFTVTAMTAEEHDELVSRIQVIPYVMSLLADQVCSTTDLNTRSKRILDSMASICKEQDRTVLMDTIIRNPFTIRILKDIEEKMNRIGGELSDRCSNVWIQH
ncbi:MAG: Rossmann-fold NAD(P)-binding domain-containing protein [Cuniculiplasma sp.]